MQKLKALFLLPAALACFLAVATPVASMAQPGLPNNPDEAPIDGGLGLLALGGGAYAISKLRKGDASKQNV